MTREKMFSITIRDCRVDTFRAGGKGGQNQNTRDSGVRVVHEPSGAVGESREERSQAQNKATAFRRMAETETFQRWVKLKMAERTGLEAAISREVDRQMQDRNLLVEVQQNERWVPE